MCEYSILYLSIPDKSWWYTNTRYWQRWLGRYSNAENHGDTWIFQSSNSILCFHVISKCVRLVGKEYEKPGWFLDIPIFKLNLLYRIVFEIWKTTVIRGYLKYAIRTVSRIDFPKVIHEHFRDSFPLCDFVYLFIHLFYVLLTHFPRSWLFWC